MPFIKVEVVSDDRKKRPKFYIPISLACKWVMSMGESNYESQFMQLVMGLQSSAWMLLGKIANPMTGKQEKNLEAAKQTIDTLLMLQAKTKGNLSNAEKSILDGAIQQLQLNYMEEAKETPKEDKRPEKGEPEDTKAGGGQEKKDEEKASKTEKETEKR
jgi:hypothetical protein